MTTKRWYLISAIAPVGALIAYAVWTVSLIIIGRISPGVLSKPIVTASFAVAMAIMPAGLVLMHMRCRRVSVLNRVLGSLIYLFVFFALCWLVMMIASAAGGGV